MTTKLLFCVPCAGRIVHTRICLKQLRHACDQLTTNGVKASAVIVADDENLDTAHDLGFATFGRANTFLSRKFNDGLQLACDPAFNPQPADYAVPLGSDDWFDWRLFLNLPAPDTVLGIRKASFVREDGLELIGREVDYTGGVGMRVYPREMLALCGYRPADEERARGCDTSILVNISAEISGRPRIEYADRGYGQFVDWKTPGGQLNPYSEIAKRFRRGTHPADPFTALHGVYPAHLLEEMQDYYEHVRARPIVATHEGGWPLYQVKRWNGYRGHPQGSTFSARLDTGAARRALDRGDITVLTPDTPKVQPGSYTLPAGWVNQQKEVGAK